MKARWLLPGALLLPLSALARVGGGGTFSTGSGSNSGGGGDGGGEIIGELVWLLVRLCIAYPQVGIPLTIVVIVAIIWAQRNSHAGEGRVVVDHRPQRRAPHRSSAFAEGFAALARRDTALSRPVLDDFLQLVYRRAWAAVGTDGWPALEPFVSVAARQAMEASIPKGTRVDEVVVAAIKPESLVVGSSQTDLTVTIIASRLETASGAASRYYVEERWTFRRASDATSLAPEPMLRLGCPGCGVAVQCDMLGRCTHCGNPITAGQLQWQAAAMKPTVRRKLDRPELHRTPGGADPSVHFPSVRSPDIAAQIRTFRARHPDFDQAAFDRRLQHLFVALQQSWSEGKWEDARPFCTDMAWNTLRFWIERYRQVGLRNRAADIVLLRSEVVRLEQDAWYEAVTVRLWASMRDWMEDARTGEVVGGNKETPHEFSEYWTLVRAVGSGAASKDPQRCPSCGAPLDKVNAAGECGYCETIITTGRFDWVLTRIDQAEVYEG